MLLTLTLALLTSLCVLQGVSEGRLVITSVSASNEKITITVSDNQTIQDHSVFNIYVYRRKTNQDIVLGTENGTTLQGGQATIQVPLDPFIFYAVRIVEYFPTVMMELEESGSDKVQFKLNDTISVKDILPRQMTVVFPKKASSESVIDGYDITYTTEGLEDFVSEGSTTTTRTETTLTNLEEGAKYSITVTPRTRSRYHQEAGHTVQQTLPIAPGASPRNLTGFVLNSSVVQINWMPPPSSERNGEIISYEIEVKDVTNDEVFSDVSLNTSSDSNRTNWTYNITGLDAGVRYKIQVAARNMAGTGKYASVDALTATSPPPTSPVPSRTSPMMSPSPTPSTPTTGGPPVQSDPLSWLYIVVPVGTMAVILGVITLVIVFFVCKVRKMATRETIAVRMSHSEGNLDDSNVYIGQHIYEDPDQCMEEFRVNAMARKLSEVEPHSHTSNPAGHHDRSANGLLNGGGYATLEMGSATDYTRNDDPELFGKQLQQSLPADYEKPWTTTTSGHYEYDDRKFSGSQNEMPNVQDYEAPILLNGDVKDESSTIIKDDVRDEGHTAINQNGGDGDHTTINEDVRDEEHTTINEDERDSGNYSPNSTEESHEQDKRGSGIYL